MICGLTARTTTSAWAAQSLVALVAMPNSVAKRFRLCSSGSEAIRSAAEKPCLIMPPIRLLAMLPPPINAIFAMLVGVLSVLL